MNEQPRDAHDKRPAKEPEAISVLIADQHAAFRTGIRAALEADGFVIAGEAGDAASAVSMSVDTRPDICLVDVVMPGNGLNAIAAIARRSPATTIVVLTVSADSADLLAALERGASGYLLKGMVAGELAKTLRAARNGEPALSRAMLPALIQQVRGRPQRQIALPDGPVELTVREWDVAELLRDGLNTAEIAGRLGVSPITVRRHMASVVKKLGVPNRQAAFRALNISGR